MPSINKQSVREEAERIKEEFNRLSANKKINSECKFLIQSMLMLINLLISIFFEKTTVRTSKNSSKSPSQTKKDESAVVKKGTHSKGNSESEEQANNTRTVEIVTEVPVLQCDVCGQDLKAVPCQHVERRTKIDIVFEKVVEHVDAEVKICPDCDSTVKGAFPSDMQGPLHYGAGLKAYIINLLICQMIALNRVQNMVKCLIGEVLSQATMLKFVLRLYEALEEWESRSIDELLKSPAMHVDETSLRVDKKIIGFMFTRQVI